MVRIIIVLATLTWYGPGFFGNETADGTLYTEEHYGIAAPAHIPLGTLVRVSYEGKSMIVPVTDRLGIDDPNHWDASYALAKWLDIIEPGKVEALIEEVRYEELYP